MANTVSVECALSYDEDLAEQREKFELIYSGLEKQLSVNGSDFNRVLLVDDVTTGSNDGFDLDIYTSASSGDENTATLVLRESMLNPLSDDLYDFIKQSTDEEELGKYKTEAGYSSPFYIAVWTLVRLGYVTHPDFP